MMVAQLPLPTELIPKHTWLVIKHQSRHVRALSVQDSEVIDGKHVVKVMGYGFSSKQIPISAIISKFETIN